MFDKKPPTWASMLSSLHHLLGLLPARRRANSDRRRHPSSTGRPLMPPFLLMRSAAICRPTTAVLPPAAAGARKWLLGADLIGLGGAEGGAPWRRHQHRRPDRAGTPADDPAARGLAAIPDVFGPFLFFPLFSHRDSPSGFPPKSIARACTILTAAGSGPWRALGELRIALANAILKVVSTRFALAAARRGRGPRVTSSRRPYSFVRDW